MVQINELETERLKLRQWGKSDLPHFASLNADPKVMNFFPNIRTVNESNLLAERLSGLIENNGWGFWAVECKADSNFIGFVGLHNCESNLPFSPAIEIGWRLARKYWGNGYATEAAKESLNFAFTTLNLNEVVSFTANNNKKSIAVMRNIGMIDTQRNFEHPNIEDDHPLKEHVLFKITKDQFTSLS